MEEMRILRVGDITEFFHNKAELAFREYLRNHARYPIGRNWV